MLAVLLAARLMYVLIVQRAAWHFRDRTCRWYMETCLPLWMTVDICSLMNSTRDVRCLHAGDEAAPQGQREWPLMRGRLLLFSYLQGPTSLLYGVPNGGVFAVMGGDFTLDFRV